MKITSSLFKNVWTFAILAISGLLLSSATLPEITDLEFPPNKWERLGQKKVSHKLDRDEIFITAREGRFTKLKFVVRNSALNMHRCVVHFANGDKQEVNVRHQFKQGSDSRVIDLKGNKRVIKKVVFWYDSKNIATGKATLVLWGRK
ncbi:MAG: hypothetical protein AAGH79_04370 [Bacteroidota bacterium]